MESLTRHTEVIHHKYTFSIRDFTRILDSTRTKCHHCECKTGTKPLVGGYHNTPDLKTEIVIDHVAKAIQSDADIEMNGASQFVWVRHWTSQSSRDSIICMLLKNWIVVGGQNEWQRKNKGDNFTAAYQ